MTIEIRWDDTDKTLLYCQFDGRWTWEEYDKAIERGCELARTVDHDVYVISDVTKSAMMPKGNPIMHFKATRAKLPQNVKLMITAGKASTYASTIINAFLKVYARQQTTLMTMTHTVEDARKMIERHTAKT